jgi:5-methylcytosine-specific restriction endonuclease McrA
MSGKLSKRPLAPPFVAQCRKRPSSALKKWILQSQDYTCLACAAPLQDQQYDHIVALGLGGGNTADNWAALCAACHKQKTLEDIRRIAKANRQRRYHQTGRSRAPRNTPACLNGICNNGFNKNLVRHVGGLVTTRCSCPNCRQSPRS